MNSKLSLLAGLKNNLDYSKNFYYSTRAVYPDLEIVLVSYNSTDGTNEWLDSLIDDNLVYYHSQENKTFSDTFNKCTQLATKDFVVFAHNDMVITPCFIENIEKNLTHNVVIYYTTIEPPVFSDDQKPGKIVKDFGSDLASLNHEALFKFSFEIRALQKDQIYPDNGTSFFLCTSKKLLLDIGGLDPLYNPMFCEDDDLILRLRLLGLKTIISLDAICYHFVSKTSRFSAEYEARTKAIEANSNKNFVRKWGFKNNSKIKKKYDIGLVVYNGNEKVLKLIEPWATTIYIDGNYEDYIKAEQPNTSLSLPDRIKMLNTPKVNDIIISFDAKKIKKKSLSTIENMNALIAKRLAEPIPFFVKLTGGTKFEFRKDIFKVTINKDSTYEKELIFKN